MFPADEQVIPNRETVPQRCYMRTGNRIKVYKVKFASILKIEMETEPFQVIELSDDQAAVNMMHDLYYGEYTGG